VDAYSPYSKLSNSSSTGGIIPQIISHWGG
jgi:hypothetical protein